MRPSGRKPSEMRALRFTPDYTLHAEGSVLAEFGNTRVLCTASVEAGVPRFLRRQVHIPRCRLHLDRLSLAPV